MAGSNVERAIRSKEKGAGEMSKKGIKQK
jgi:hypothetical protein